LTRTPHFCRGLYLTLPRTSARFSQSSSVALLGGALLNRSRNAAITWDRVCTVCCLSCTHTVCPLCCLSRTHTVCPLCCLSRTHTVCPLCCLSHTHTVCPLCCLSHTHSLSPVLSLTHPHSLSPVLFLSHTHTDYQAPLDTVTACVSHMENETKFCGCDKSRILDTVANLSFYIVLRTVLCCVNLTFWRRNFLLNYSTFCI
jgi:hypothetical protein